MIKCFFDSSTPVFMQSKANWLLHDIHINMRVELIFLCNPLLKSKCSQNVKPLPLDQFL